MEGKRLLMELTNVRVTYRIGVTVPTGSFANVRPEYEISVDVPDGVNPTEAKQKIKNLADKWLEADVAEIEAEKNA